MILALVESHGWKGKFPRSRRCRLASSEMHPIDNPARKSHSAFLCHTWLRLALLLETVLNTQSITLKITASSFYECRRSSKVAFIAEIQYYTESSMREFLLGSLNHPDLSYLIPTIAFTVIKAPTRTVVIASNLSITVEVLKNVVRCHILSCRAMATWAYTRIHLP